MKYRNILSRIRQYERNRPRPNKYLSIGFSHFMMALLLLVQYVIHVHVCTTIDMT